MKKEMISKEESGQGTIEYALIITILSVLAIATWRTVGQKVIEMLTGVVNSF